MATSTSPTAYQEWSGRQLAYYVGSDHAIHLWLYGNEGWVNQTLGGAVATGTSPFGY